MPLRAAACFFPPHNVIHKHTQHRCLSARSRLWALLYPKFPGPRINPANPRGNVRLFQSITLHRTKAVPPLRIDKLFYLIRSDPCRSLRLPSRTCCLGKTWHRRCSLTQRTLTQFSNLESRTPRTPNHMVYGLNRACSIYRPVSR